MNIISKEEIIKYLLFEKSNRYERDRFNGVIKLKTPNLAEDASESLACHLIKDGSILKQLHPIIKVERQGRIGKDIFVNGYHKIEVKGTSSVNGCVTTSQSNFDSFAWVWCDFRPFFETDKYIIPIHIITNPKICITSERYVEALNQNKLSLTSVIKDAFKTGNYEYYDFNLKMMVVLEDISKRFIV